MRIPSIYLETTIFNFPFANDALHIAAATVSGLDYIISLNFRHIVKHKTIIGTELINAREGYKRMFIHNPAEVIEHEEEI